MANSILKLNVETSEYDAKLKSAVEGIRHLAEVAHKSAGDMAGLEKSELDYIKALGDMDTKSKTAAGSTRELESAFKELTVIYNQLNDVEKADEGGKALAASLEQLKQRALDARAGLNEATQALQGNASASKADNDMLAQLASKFTINVDAIKLFNLGLQAANVALDVAKDAFFASEANVDEWGRTIQSAQSLYEGFLNAINNSDISGYLSRMDEIVAAAREAYNEMDRLGTLQTIQKPEISRQQAEVDRLRTMIQTGRWIDASDGRKSALGYKEGDVISKEHLKVIEQQLQSGMAKIVDLHRNEVQQQTRAIDAEYKSMAADLGMSLAEFRKGTSTMAKFEEMLAGAKRYNQFEQQHTQSVTYTGSNGLPVTTTIRDNAVNPDARYKGWDNFRVDGNRYNKLVDLIQQRDQHLSQIYSMLGQTYRVINRAEGISTRKIMGGDEGGRGEKSRKEQAQKMVDDALLSYNQTIEKANIELQSGKADEEKVKKQNLSALEQLWTAYGKAYDTYADPKYKEAQDKTVNDIIGLGGEIRSLEEAQKKAKEAAQLQERAQRKLAEALTELYNAIEKGDVQSIVTAQNKVTTSREEYERTVSTTSNAVSTTQTVDVVTGSVELPDVPKEVKQTVNVVPGTIDLPQIPETVDIYANVVASETSVASAVREIQQSLSQAAVGSTEYDTEKKRLADINALNSIVSVEQKYNLKADAGKQSDLLRQILGKTDIEDGVWQELETSINEQLAKLNIKPIKINLNTGKLTEDANKATEAWKGAASAISTVGQSLQSIEDPAAKVIGLVAQAVASVAASAGSIMAQNASQRQMTWYEYLAMGASVTAQMIATISAIHSATGYAEGGIVKGNTYSGDMIPANGGAITLNAGELILNRSQQATLAADIGRSSISGGGSSQPYVTADKIVLGINNWGKKTGRGELIFSR